MACHNGFCCGPRRLPWYLQFPAYILVICFLIIAILQFLNLVGTSLSQCAEKPERCKVGTPLNAIMGFIAATAGWYLFVFLVALPFLIFWTTERALANLVLAGAFLCVTAFFIIIQGRIFAENMQRSISDAPGLVMHIVAAVVEVFYFGLMLAAFIRTYYVRNPDDDRALLINRL